jgi:hypothetical protein
MNMPSMKANELRIGNLVDLGNRIAKVIEINHLICVVVDLEETQDTIEDYERVKGIPLTEEWLLKFGFTDEDDYLELQIHESLSIIYVGYLALIIDGVIIQVNNTNSDKVHQLQNLYFALTGEELILNI